VISTEQVREFTLVPARSALLVVGAENEFVHPDGRLYAGPSARESVSNMSGLLARARQAQMKIFFINSVRAPDAPEFTRFGLSPFLLEGTWNAEITDELKPRSNEVVVETRSHDSFAKTELENRLRKYDVRPCEDQVVIMGGSIHASVHQAATGFGVRLYHVIVPLDCTYGEKDARERTVKWLLGYRRYYNVALTDSNRIKIKPSALVARSAEDTKK